MRPDEISHELSQLVLLELARRDVSGSQLEQGSKLGGR